MRKGSDLLGKPVVAFDTGQKLEKISDLIFDQHSNRLLGFVVDEGGWLSNAKVLPLNSVQAIGLDAVLTPTRGAVVTAERFPEIKRILDRNNVLKGTRLMTTDGRLLGTLTDLYFDEHTGAIEGYEVSGGLFADVTSGRSFVPAPQTVKIGEDVAFVPPEIISLMEEREAGLSATGLPSDLAPQDLTERSTVALTGGPLDPAAQQAFVVGKVARQAVVTPDGMLVVADGQEITPALAEEAERYGVLDELYRAVGGRVTTALEQSRGRRVRSEIRTSEGAIIAAPGQIVTDRVIQRAQAAGMEPELLVATGLSSDDDVPQAAVEAGQRIEATAAQAQAGLGDLLHSVRTRLDEFKDRNAQEIEERRIKAALGRPVTRVILDPQDRVILNVGELITHEAVQRARQSGVLDILLDSVYEREPEIATQELRAGEPGEAALSTTATADRRSTF